MANYSGWGLGLSFYADQDFSSCGQYRFVVPASTADYVKLAATANASVLGVIQNNPKSGEVATVRVLGTTQLRIDAASAASFGGYLKAGSDGQGVGYESVTASVQAIAMALEAMTSGSGVNIEALLLPQAARG